MEKLYKVRITPRAEQSMQEIASYIAVDLMEPQTAVKLLRALKKAIDSLDMFPDASALPRRSRGIALVSAAWW